MAAMTFCASICFGNGSWTRMPLTSSFALSSEMSAISSGSLVLAGNL